MTRGEYGPQDAAADRFLDALQGVLAGAMSPEEAMEATETEAERVRGKIKT